MPEEPWVCPWCGEPVPGTVGVVESKRDIMAADRWYEEHSMECEPYLAETEGK